jgi:hypothetical protein
MELVVIFHKLPEMVTFLLPHVLLNYNKTLLVPTAHSSSFDYILQISTNIALLFGLFFSTGHLILDVLLMTYLDLFPMFPLMLARIEP